MARAEQPDRPRQVRWALLLFWATIALGLLKLAITLSSPGDANGLAVASFIAVFGLMALINVYIAMGASWARGLMAVLFILAIVPALPLALSRFDAIPVLATATVAQASAQAAGLFLVYRQPAASWFRRPRTD